MEYRPCGSSGLSLPVLGIGCWSFGGGAYWGDQRQRDATEIVARAIELGCSYFDTAEVYNDGRSESALGVALAGRRHEAIVGTKLSPHHARPRDLRRRCEASLGRLRTDYLDLYMLHWPLHPRSIPHYTDDPALAASPPDTDAAFEELLRLRDEGKIRYLGVSNFGRRQLEEVAAYEVAVDEICYNLLTRAVEYEILPHCRTNRIGVIGYMPLLQGILTGKYASVRDIPPQRTRTRHFRGDRPGSRHGEPGHEELLQETLDRIRAVADDLGVPMMRLALAWTMSGPAVSCVINGVRDVGQLLENVSAATTRLDQATMEALDAATGTLKHALGPSPDLYEPSCLPRVF